MAVAQDKPSTNAIVALVLGILSFFGFGFLTGIPAWIMGRNELRAIDSGSSPSAGRTLATIGMWLGIVATALAILALVFFLFVAGGMAALTAGAGSR
jgi:hypothetical protein